MKYYVLLCFLAFCFINFTSSRLLNCYDGPKFWCSNIKNAKACQKLNECPNLWRKELGDSVIIEKITTEAPQRIFLIVRNEKTEDGTVFRGGGAPCSNAVQKQSSNVDDIYQKLILDQNMNIFDNQNKFLFGRRNKKTQLHAFYQSVQKTKSKIVIKVNETTPAFSNNKNKVVYSSTEGGISDVAITNSFIDKIISKYNEIESLASSANINHFSKDPETLVQIHQTRSTHYFKAIRPFMATLDKLIPIKSTQSGSIITYVPKSVV